MRLALFVLSAGLALSALPAAAQDDVTFGFGGDVYAAGETVTLTDAGADSVFMAGYRVEQGIAITGSAHLAGRHVLSGAAVGENLYAAGDQVRATGPVAGDATLAGRTVEVAGPVSGNLRASGGTVEVTAPVTGAALLAAEEVTLDAIIAGDAAITAAALLFGASARVDGMLYLYEEAEGDLSVPATVAPPERIRRVLIEEGTVADLPDAFDRPTPWRRDMQDIAWRTARSILVVAVLAALAAAIIPRTMAGLRARLVSGPFGALGWGFLTLSALIGSVVVAGLTLVGLVLAPVSIVLAILTGLAGYVVGVWTLGAGLFTRFGRVGEPDTLGEAALSAAIGAVLAGLLALLPFVGWLIVLGIALSGAGAIMLALFRPAFYAR